MTLETYLLTELSKLGNYRSSKTRIILEFSRGIVVVTKKPDHWLVRINTKTASLSYQMDDDEFVFLLEYLDSDWATALLGEPD